MSIIRDIGHILIRVEEMTQALAFYRDLLGFRVVGKANPEWTVLETKGGQITLWRAKSVVPLALGPEGRGTPFTFHVEEFDAAATFLASKGVKVHREGSHSGVIWDPFGNVIGLHDHRESES